MDDKQKSTKTTKKKFTSLKEEGLLKKLGIAVLLMAIIPLLLMLYILHLIVFPVLGDQVISIDFIGLQLEGAAVVIIQKIVIWMLCFIAVGILVIRRSITMILSVVKDARAIADGDFTRRVHVHESDEISEIARAFNRITRDLEKKIRDLEASKKLIQKLLSKIGLAMTSYEGLENILDLVVENMVAALAAEKGALMLVDDQKADLFVKACFGLDAVASEQRVRVGEGVIGWVAQQGKPMRVSGAQGDSRFSEADQRLGHTPQALMCVPLFSRGVVIGALSVSGKTTEGEFTEDDVVLLSNVASQLSMAIDNYRLSTDVERAYIETITALAMAVEAKDAYSLGHSERVSKYALKIAQAMKLDDTMQQILRDGAILHDIGKIGIKDNILKKHDRLTDEEYKLMQEHSIIGEAIIKPVHSLSEVAHLIRSHQEYYDGSGYPDGLKGDQIPLAARIMLVCDAFDAMITDRPYRKKMTIHEAKEELTRNAGTQFDPEIVDVFLKIVDDIIT